MGHGILLSGGAEVDFNIHGVFQYSFFGHPVWITTSHICILIVMLLLVAFAIAANRCMAKASQVPGSFQNVVEMIVDVFLCKGKYYNVQLHNLPPGVLLLYCLCKTKLRLQYTIPIILLSLCG